MKPRVRIDAAALGRRLARIGEALETIALDAAVDALAEEIARARERAGLAGPLTRIHRTGRRVLEAPDAASVARELGSSSETPAPWLAPVLPAARGPMRAAVLARLRAWAAALPRMRGGAAARALSRLRERL